MYYYLLLLTIQKEEISILLTGGIRLQILRMSLICHEINDVKLQLSST